MLGYELAPTIRHRYEATHNKYELSKFVFTNLQVRGFRFYL